MAAERFSGRGGTQANTSAEQGRNSGETHEMLMVLLKMVQNLGNRNEERGREQ